MTTAVAPSTRTYAGTDLRVLILALASVAAAVVHAMVAPEHLRESVLYGAFFLGTTAAGLGYAAVVLTRPTTPVLVTGLVANVSVIALWLFTRLVEVPVGPMAGETEAFGRLDVMASSAELLCVLACAACLARLRRGHVRI